MASEEEVPTARAPTGAFRVGRVGIKTVEHVLREQGRVGSFVVRESTSRPSALALSVKTGHHAGGVRHFAVHRDATRDATGVEACAWFAPELPGEIFATVDAFVQRWAHVCLHGAADLFVNENGGSGTASSSAALTGSADAPQTAGAAAAKPTTTTPPPPPPSSLAPPPPRPPRAPSQSSDSPAGSPSPSPTPGAWGQSDEVYAQATGLLDGAAGQREAVEHPTGVSAHVITLLLDEMVARFPNRHACMTTSDVNNEIVRPATADLPGHSQDRHYVALIRRDPSRFTPRRVRAGDDAVVVDDGADDRGGGDGTDADSGQGPLAPATVFVSHAWRYKFNEVVRVMLDYAASRPPGEETYFWFDMLQNSQHHTAKRPHEWWRDVFKTSIGRIGSVLLVLLPWQRPEPIGRAWCLFEILCAIEEKTAFHVGLPGAQQDALVASLASGDSTVLRALGAIDAENADAWNPHDKDMIFRLVRSTVGFERLNDMVREHLRGWVVATAERHAFRSGHGLGLRLLTSAATLFQRLGKADHAARLCERRLEEATRRFSERHPLVGQAWANLGAIHFELNDLPNSIHCTRRAIAIFEGGGGDDDELSDKDRCDGSGGGGGGDDDDAGTCGRTKHARDAAMAYLNLGHSHRHSGDAKSALFCYKRAEATARGMQRGSGSAVVATDATADAADATVDAEATGDSSGGNVAAGKVLAHAVSAVGEMLRLCGDPEVAVSKHQEALAIKRRLGRSNELSTAVVLHNLALARQDLGDWLGSRDALAEALAIRQAILGERSPDTAATRAQLQQACARVRKKRNAFVRP